VLLYPLYHPAAALYTPSMLKVLEEDFGRIPGLIDRAGVASPPAVAAPAVLAPAVEEPREAVQLGLF
jgi:DNA polymerase